MPMEPWIQRGRWKKFCWSFRAFFLCRWPSSLPESCLGFDNELRRRATTGPAKLSLEMNCLLLFSCSSKNSVTRITDLTTCDVEALQMITCIWSQVQFTVEASLGPLKRNYSNIAQKITQSTKKFFDPYPFFCPPWKKSKITTSWILSYLLWSGFWSAQVSRTRTCILLIRAKALIAPIYSNLLSAELIRHPKACMGGAPTSFRTWPIPHSSYSWIHLHFIRITYHRLAPFSTEILHQPLHLGCWGRGSWRRRPQKYLSARHSQPRNVQHSWCLPPKVYYGRLIVSV